MGLYHFSSVLAKRAPDVGDALDEAVVGNECVRPDGGDQFALRHQVAGIARQMGQHLGTLAAQGHQIALLIPQIPRGNIEAHRPDPHDFGAFRVGFGLVSGHLIPPSGLLS